MGKYARLNHCSNTLRFLEYRTIVILTILRLKNWVILGTPVILLGDRHHLLAKATPIEGLDQDDTGGQLKLEGWLNIAVIFFTLLNEEAPLFIGNLQEEVPFYW